MAELSSYPAVTTLAVTDRIPVITNPGVIGGNKYITAANFAADTGLTSKYAAGVAKTIYVSPAGNDANAGLIDSQAKLTLSAAITALAGTPGKIIMAAGTYNESAMVTVSGHGYNGITIQGAGMALSMLNFSATATAGLKLIDVSNFTLRDFSINSSAGTLTYGLMLTATGSMEVGLVENMVIAPTTGAITNGFGVGPDTSVDVSEITFVHCHASNCSGAGWLVGNGTPANVLDIRAFGCIARLSVIGVHINGGGITWSHGTTLGNSTADFKCSVPANSPILIEGVRSEGSGRFWDFQSGHTTGSTTVTLLGNVVAQYTDAASVVVNHIARTPLTIIGGAYYGGVGDTRMVIGESATACEFAAQGVSVGRTATTSPFEPYGGTGARLSVSGCTRRDGSGVAQPALSWNTVVVRTVFNVMDYGAVGDGTADDSAAVQAAITAAAAVGGGQILWPAGCKTRIITCVNFPATGQFVLRCDKPSTSVYSYNASDPSSAIVTNNTIGGQPTAFGNSALYKFAFYVPPSTASNRRFSLVFENLLFYNTDGYGKLGVVGVNDNNMSLFEVSHCYVQNLEIGYFRNSTEQIDRLLIRNNRMSEGGGMWFELNPPELGVITGNNIGLVGDTQNPKTKAQFLQANGFWGFFIDHNYFEVGGTVAVKSAVIWFDGITQTQDGSIHDNMFYGAGDGCIYVQSSRIDLNTNATGGLRIHDNMFTNWGLNNVAAGLRSAITVDVPGVGGAHADVHIGSNSYFGSANSDYGIVLLGDPVAQGITVSRDQFMKFIVVAPLKANGITYGGPGDVRELAFYAPVLPQYPAHPVAPSTGWAVSNVTTDKVFDANATSIDELADVVGTLITYLISRGDLTA